MERAAESSSPNPAATQVLHRFTELISGPVPDQSYRPLPSSDSTELAELAIKEEDAEGVSASTMSPEEWKRRSVEMDLQTWVRRMYVLLGRRTDGNRLLTQFFV